MNKLIDCVTYSPGVIPVSEVSNSVVYRNLTESEVNNSKKSTCKGEDCIDKVLKPKNMER